MMNHRVDDGYLMMLPLPSDPSQSTKTKRRYWMTIKRQSELIKHHLLQKRTLHVTSLMSGLKGKSNLIFDLTIRNLACRAKGYWKKFPYKKINHNNRLDTKTVNYYTDDVIVSDKYFLYHNVECPIQQHIFLKPLLLKYI